MTNERNRARGVREANRDEEFYVSASSQLETAVKAFRDLLPPSKRTSIELTPIVEFDKALVHENRSNPENEDDDLAQYRLRLGNGEFYVFIERHLQQGHVPTSQISLMRIDVLEKEPFYFRPDKSGVLQLHADANSERYVVGIRGSGLSETIKFLDEYVNAEPKPRSEGAKLAPLRRRGGPGEE